MVTGALKSQVDAVWNAFWSGGIANPVEVIEQITYLLFIRRLDDLQTLAENRASTTGVAIGNPVFGEGMSEPAGRIPRSLHDLRWSRFKNLEAKAMFEVVDDHVFPFLRSMGEQGSSFAANMKDARFTIATPALLAKVVDLLEAIPMDDRDAKGDIYEYMLSKLATSGTNGQFRTPRHIIRLMVDMTAPKPGDRIVDPAAGTAGFLTVASEYLREHHEEIWADASARDHFNRHAFSGFDSDATMSRIGSMNLLLHGVEAATVTRRDSLAEGVGSDDGEFSLVLANPPFAGTVDAESIANDLTRVVKTKKTELLFLALMLRMMKNGGRAAVIVPDGVLFGSSNAHKDLRRMLVDDHKLDAVVKLPSGVFKPYAGVSTAILFFTKTSSGGTDHVWFYDVQSDGFSLDDKRAVVESSDLPDVLTRWQSLSDADSPERDRPRTAQSFLVPHQEIIDAGYDLSLNRYKEVEHDEVEHRDPLDIIAELQALEAEMMRRASSITVHLGSHANRRGLEDSVRLGDVAEFVRGVTFKPESVVDPDIPGALRFMRTTNVKDDLELVDVKAISTNVKVRQDQMLREGDILVSTANSWNLVGRASFVPELPWECTFGGFVSVLRTTDETFSPRFLHAWFVSPAVQSRLRSFGRQTTNISNLDMKRTLDLIVPRPDDQTLLTFNFATAESADLKLVLRQQLSLVEELSASVHGHAFTGTL